MKEEPIVKTTVFVCGCEARWKVEPLTATPLVCPVHRAIWARSYSVPVLCWNDTGHGSDGEDQ